MDDLVNIIDELIEKTKNKAIYLLESNLTKNTDERIINEYKIIQEELKLNVLREIREILIIQINQKGEIKKRN